MIITRKALDRRTFLRGVGATVALPFLDAMVPAMKAQSGSSGAPRFAAVYIGNGANMPEWTPKTDGANFEMSPILKGIEEYRDRMAVFTNLDNFPGTDQGDVGGQHPRAVPHGRRQGDHQQGDQVPAPARSASEIGRSARSPISFSLSFSFFSFSLSPND